MRRLKELKLITDLKIKLGRLYEFLEPFVLEIEKITYVYPASKEHHHKEDEGLFIHSLEVANKMIEIFEENRDEYLPRYENEKTGEYQSRYEKMLFHLALTGLLHDIGKIGAYEIKSRWYYIPFITSTKDILDEDFKIEGNKGVNYINSTHLSGLAFGILLERAGKKYYESFLYDFRYITMMLEAVHLEHYRVMVDNSILRILKKADGMSVAQERNEVFIERKEEIKELDLAQAYIDIFKKWTLSSTDLYFYSGDYFLILNPALHQKIVKQINEILGEPVSEDVIIDELLERGYSDERIVKKSIKLPSGKVVDFSVLPIKADKVFSQKELESKRFKKVEIQSQNVNEVEL